MVLGGMALALSRLIYNSLVVLENIFRHFEMGADSVRASETGGKEVQLAVLAATCSTAIVFFPVVLLTGVSKYLFSALALAVVIALFCSYSVAMTFVPLFCSRFIRHTGHGRAHEAAEKDDPVPEHMRGNQDHMGSFAKIVFYFNEGFGLLQAKYDSAIHYCLGRPGTVIAVFAVFVILSFALFPFLGQAYFPKTDAGQFVISVKAPSGTRIELTDQYIAHVEQANAHSRSWSARDGVQCLTVSGRVKLVAADVTTLTE
jgi:multidrug efflux pump subunit AcrB